MIAPPLPPTARGSRPVDTWNVTGRPVSSTSDQSARRRGRCTRCGPRPSARRRGRCRGTGRRSRARLPSATSARAQSRSPVAMRRKRTGAAVGPTTRRRRGTRRPSDSTRGTWRRRTRGRASPSTAVPCWGRSARCRRRPRPGRRGARRWCGRSRCATRPRARGAGEVPAARPRPAASTASGGLIIIGRLPSVTEYCDAVVAHLEVRDAARGNSGSM